MTTVLRLARDRVTAVWLLLVSATILSWYLGTDHGFDKAATTTTVIMVVAFAKVRLIGLYFMELRCAPTALRGAFEGYCVVVCATVLGIYHLA